MCKYTIELWFVDKIDIKNISIGDVDIYYSDNLVDVLKFLKIKEVFFCNLNQFRIGEYNYKYLNVWKSRTYLANIYLRGKLLKFQEIDFYRKGFPKYTACGYKIKQKQLNRKIKYNYSNLKHPTNQIKSYSRCFVEAKEIEYSKYNIPNKDISKLKKKPYMSKSWDLYEKVRSHNSMSWKNQKKRRQWQ